MSEEINGHHIDYLALGRGNNANGLIAMITVRLKPEENKVTHNLMLTVEQALRLRDNLNYEFPEDEFPAQERMFPEEFKAATD